MKVSIERISPTCLFAILRNPLPRSRRILIILLALLLLLSGCVDLAAVQNFAGLSKQASDGYAGIVEDLYQSCLRSAGYDPPTNETPEQHCAEFKSVQPAMLKTESVLHDYLVALGKLAGDDKVSYDKQEDSLKKELEGVKLSGKAVFEPKQVDAVTGLADHLLKMATDGYRRKELERVIDAQNDNLQLTTKALEAVVGDYEGRIDNEKTSVEAFQVRVHRAEQKEPLAFEIGTREVQQHLDDLEKKKQAAESYVKTLDLIAKGHQQLFDHKKDLKSKELSKSLRDDLSEMASDISSIRKAF